MRWLLSILFVSIVAIALALAGRYAPGYVILVLPPWRIEMSFLAFLLLLVAAVGTVLLFARLARLTLRLPQQVREARQRREVEKQEALYQAAVTAWFEGRYQEAEHAGSKCSASCEKVGLARVIAARAAHALRAAERRDAHLVLAKEYAPLAALQFEAEVYLDANDPLGALRALEEALTLSPRHVGMLRLKLQALLKSRRWQEALTLAEDLARHNHLDTQQAGQMRLATQLGLLRQNGMDNETLLAFWRKIPEHEQRLPLLARGGAEAFLRLGNLTTAARIVERALEEKWQEDLAFFYGSITTDNLPRQVDLAEGWLKSHPRDAGLLLSLARLCAAASLWGKAKNYLEASLSLKPSVEGLLALAELEEKSDRSGAACGHLKQALALCRRQAS